jgi:hypothetical protein
MSLDYRPMLLFHQLFRETVPLNESADQKFVQKRIEDVGGMVSG